MFCLVFAGPAVLSELQGSKTQGFLLFFADQNLLALSSFPGSNRGKLMVFFAFSVCKVNPLSTLAALTFKNSRFLAFFFGPRSSFVGSVAFFFWKT